MNNAATLWEAALPYIKENISETGYSTMFTKVKPVTMQNDKLILSTPNQLYKDMFDLYQEAAEEALLLAHQRLIVVEVVVEGEPDFLLQPTADAPAQPTENAAALNPKFTFESFIVGSNSEFAYAAAYSVTQGAVRDTYNPLLLYGGSGLGKTHLLHAVGNEISKNDPTKKILCVTAEKFINSFIDSIRTENNMEFRNKFRTIDVLLIDDIQFFAGKERTQEEFFHTFNELINQNKQIVLTSDRPPKDIYPLEERLRTRLAGGLMTDLQPPDFETRIAILHSKVQCNNFQGEITDEIFSLVAQQVKSNIRELEGAIRTIVAYCDVSKREINVDTAQRILENYFTGTQKRKIDADLIIKEVEKHFNLSEGAIVSPKRDRIYAYPRQLAMTICRQLTQLSYPEIGKEFGGRDHTTVLHNIKKIQSLAEKDLDTMNTLNDLVKNITNE